MKFRDLLEKNHYKSIIVLLILFEGDRGLRQAHFRYALMDDPELHKYTVIEMERFFENKLHYLFDVYLGENFSWEKGCIHSRQELTNFLMRLEEMKIIKKHGKKRKIRYKLTPKFASEFIKMTVMEEINRWNDVTQSKLRGFDTDSSNGIDSLTLFGLYNQLKNLSSNDVNLIKECLKNITDNARKILEIKYKNTKFKENKFYRVEFSLHYDSRMFKEADYSRWQSYLKKIQQKEEISNDL